MFYFFLHGQLHPMKREESLFDPSITEGTDQEIHLNPHRVNTICLDFNTDFSDTL